MDEEELMKIINNKNSSFEQVFEKLEELKSQGVDYPYLLCTYILKYPKYKKKKVSISLWEFAQLVMSNKNKSETINNVFNGLQEMRKHLDDIGRR